MRWSPPAADGGRGARRNAFSFDLCARVKQDGANLICSPFLYLIRERKTGAVLFLGRVAGF